MAVAGDLDGRRADTDRDPTLDQCREYEIRGELLLAPKQARKRLDDRDLRTKRRPGLAELDADDATAEHDQPLGHELRRRRRAVRPGVRVCEPRDRRQGRFAARREDDGSPCADHTAVQLHLPLTRETRVPAQNGDAALLEPRELDGVVEVMDHLVATAQHRLDVETAGDRLARAGNPLRLRQGLRRTEQRLRRHAAVEGALTADEVALDDCHAEARLPEPAGADLACRPGSNDDDVELVSGHLVSLNWIAQPQRRQ